MLVPQDQSKLGAGIPAVRGLLIPFFVALFKVEGGEVDVVSKREKEYPPRNTVNALLKCRGRQP